MSKPEHITNPPFQVNVAGATAIHGSRLHTSISRNCSQTTSYLRILITPTHDCHVLPTTLRVALIHKSVLDSSYIETCQLHTNTGWGICICTVELRIQNLHEMSGKPIYVILTDWV